MDPLAERQALARVIEVGMVWHCLCAITRVGSPSGWRGTGWRLERVVASQAR